MQKLDNMTWMFLVLLILGVTLFGIQKEYKIKLIKEKNQKEIITKYIYLNRIDLNDLIKNLVYSQKERVLSYYDKYTKNRTITELIVYNAIETKIPINLFFAQCWQESRFKPKVKSKLNRNKSRDYGLFQLNSSVYKYYKISFLMIPDNNVRIASKHLLTNYNRYKTWEEAIVSYNCGKNYNVPKSTMKYLTSILNKEKEISEDFIKELNI